MNSNPRNHQGGLKIARKVAKLGCFFPDSQIPRFASLDQTCNMGGKLTKRSSQQVETGITAPVVVYDQLHLVNMVFKGIDRLEPALFDPTVLEYTIYRTKGQQLTYSLTDNLTARPGPGGKRSVPFPGFTNYLTSPLYSRYNGSKGLPIR